MENKNGNSHKGLSDLYKQFEINRTLLKDFITTPENGLLIDANEAYSLRHPEDSSSGKAAFELFDTGLLAEKFIKIYEIIDHPNVYNKCIEVLSLKAKEIYDKTSFSCIVADNPMGIELANNVIEWLRINVNQEISICKLWKQIDGDDSGLLEEHVLGKKVIVLTDAVITGGRIKNVCKDVKDQGGIPIAVLSMVTISGQQSDDPNSQADISRIILDGDDEVPHFTLTDVSISTAKEEDKDHVKRIPINYNKVSWEIYRIELRKFIKSEKSGMVFDADKSYESQNLEYKSDGRAAFNLHSGQLVKQFVSIWEIFDHSEAFNKCMDMLTLKAREIYEKTHFSRIATCTPTAKELANYVLDGLRKHIEDDIDVYHFGDYHSHGQISPKPDVFDKDEPVLILTDVVSTGTLVKDMGEQIIKHGGTPVAILTVVVTDKQWIDRQRLSTEEERIELKKGGKPCVYSLSDLPIDVVPPDGEYDADKIIPIDFASILPVEEHVSTGQYEPEFTTPELLKFAESAQAIDFGFYNFDEKRFTTAFVITRLLEKHGDIIWDKIKVPILDAASENKDLPLVLVSSFKQKDLLFKDFVQTKLNAEGHKSSTVITLKRDVKDCAYLNLTLGDEKSDTKSKTNLANRTVVLLLGTITTADKLRSIVTLLLAQRVQKVTVICLFNRMGIYTTSFIGAIARFAKRVSTETRSSEETLRIERKSENNAMVLREDEEQISDDTFTGFEFHMVFNHLDIPYENILKMHDLVDLELTHFKTRTKSDVLRRVAERMSECFAPTSCVTRTFDCSAYEALSSPFESINEGVNAQAVTHEGKIAIIVHDLVLNHNYECVLREMTETLDCRTIIHLLGLILADIDYLHFNGFLEEFAGRITGRIRELRNMRFKLEMNSDQESISEEVDRIVNAEVHLIFVLGMIASHEPALSLDSVMPFKELLLCGKTTQEWLNFPNNRWSYYMDERLFFAISFLIHALYPDFNKKSSAEQLKREIVQQVHSLRWMLKNYEEEEVKEIEPDKAQDYIDVVNSNLEQLLTETGSYEQLLKHHVIRYLHRENLRPKANHNTVLAALGPLTKEVWEFFNEKVDTRAKRYSIDREMLNKVNHALTASAVMPIVAKNACRLFYFTPSAYKKQERYINPATAEGLANDAEEILKCLQDIKRRQKICRADADKLQGLERRYREDIERSPLRNVLTGYVVDLGELVERSIKEVCQRLGRSRLRDSLAEHAVSITSKREEEEYKWPVMCDYRLLHVTLQNIFLNIRHSFPGKRRAAITAESIQIDIDKTTMEVELETAPLDAVCLRITIYGGIAPHKKDLTELSLTIGDQLNNLREYGVTHELEVANDASKYIQTVILESRKGYPNSFATNYIKREE